MSHQNNSTVQSSRAQQQIERLQNILFERTQQLQAAEHQITKTHITVKHARRNVRLLMALCALLIVIMSAGGAA